MKAFLWGLKQFDKYNLFERGLSSIKLVLWIHLWLFCCRCCATFMCHHFHRKLEWGSHHFLVGCNTSHVFDREIDQLFILKLLCTTLSDISENVVNIWKAVNVHKRWWFGLYRYKFLKKVKTSYLHILNCLLKIPLYLHRRVCHRNRTKSRCLRLANSWGCELFWKTYW